MCFELVAMRLFKVELTCDLGKSEKIGCVLSFLVPMFYRLLLEVLAGSTPLGYDCVAFYVRWIMYPYSFMEGLKYFPLYNFLLLCLNFLVKDAFLAVKMGSILVSGFLGYSIYKWLKAVGLENYSIYYTLLIFFSVPTLRLSWDLHRNCFGLSLALLSMSYLKNGKKKLAYFLAFAAGFSHPFAAMALAAMNFGSIFLKKNVDSFSLTFFSLLGMVSTQISSNFSYLNMQINYTLSTDFVEKIIAAYGFGGILLVPLVPFIAGFRKNFRKIINKFGSENFWWFFWFLFIAHFFHNSDRFFYMLGIPLGIIVACNITVEGNKKRQKALLCVVLISMLVYTGVGVFNSSIPLRYTPEVMYLFEYCEKLLDNSSIVLVHRSLLGFALEAGIGLEKIVIVEPYENFSMKMYLIENASMVFVVWWLKGKYWEGGHLLIRIFPFLGSRYGMYDVPSGFKIVKKGGGFALYLSKME